MAALKTQTWTPYGCNPKTFTIASDSFPTDHVNHIHLTIFFLFRLIIFWYLELIAEESERLNLGVEL
jgi:hypothetical protein